MLIIYVVMSAWVLSDWCFEVHGSIGKCWLWWCNLFMVTSWHGNRFHITGRLFGNLSVAVGSSSRERVGNIKLWWFRCLQLNKQSNCRKFEHQVRLKSPATPNFVQYIVPAINKYINHHYSQLCEGNLRMISGYPDKVPIMRDALRYHDVITHWK